jgi:hypothetical protein
MDNSGLRRQPPKTGADVRNAGKQGVGRSGIEPPTFRFSGLGASSERARQAGARSVLDRPSTPVAVHVGVTAGVGDHWVSTRSSEGSGCGGLERHLWWVSAQLLSAPMTWGNRF